MATSGDIHLATREDFFMATDSHALECHGVVIERTMTGEE